MDALSKVHPKVLNWLLNPREPSIRFLSLRDLVSESAKDKVELQEAYSDITKKGWVAKILGQQLQAGFWHNYEMLFWPKYVSTAYMVMTLVDLGVTKDNPNLKRSCELLLDAMSKTSDGGFGGSGNTHFCVTGNFARTFINAGYSEDSRVKKALDWIVDSQKQDGGWNCFPSKDGTLDSWEGLSAFAALPMEKRTRKIKRSIERGAEFYLERRLHKEGKDPYKSWFRSHYPVHYYYDLLVGLDILTSLGYYHDKRLGFALSILRKKCRSDGRWLLDAIPPDIDQDDPYQSWPPYEPFPPIRFGLEEVGRPSKMITLRALRVLQRTS